MRCFLISVIFIFFGCSTKTPVNNWQYQSVNTYKSFEKYYLQNHLNLASVELQNARTYASQSSDLNTLARIELSYCALRVAMLENFSCPRYEKLKALINSNELEAYEAFLSKTITKKQISSLPQKYKNIALAQLKDDKSDINEQIKNISPITSKMIAASLNLKYIDINIIDSIIDESSYNGYKNAVIAWLNLKLQHTTDKKKRDIIIRKLKILQG